LSEGDIEIPQFPTRIEAKSSESSASSASRSFGNSEKSEDGNTGGVSGVQGGDDVLHLTKKSKTHETEDTEDDETVDEDDEEDEFGVISTADSSLKHNYNSNINSIESKRWSGLSSNASSVLFEFLRSTDSIDQLHQLQQQEQQQKNPSRPSLFVSIGDHSAHNSTKSSDDSSASPNLTPIASSRAQDALLSFSSDSVDEDSRRSKIGVAQDRFEVPGEDLKCRTMSTLSGSPRALSALSSEQISASAADVSNLSVFSGLSSDQHTYTPVYLQVPDAVTSRGIDKPILEEEGDEKEEQKVLPEDEETKTVCVMSSSSTSSSKQTLAPVPTILKSNKPVPIVVVARRRGEFTSLTPPAASSVSSFPVPPTAIAPDSSLQSVDRGDRPASTPSGSNENNNNKIPTKEELQMKQTAERAAEHDAVNAKLAALKAQRVAREIKRMRTAVFQLNPRQPQASPATRTDSQYNLNEAVEREKRSQSIELPPVFIQPTSSKSDLFDEVNVMDQYDSQDSDVSDNDDSDSFAVPVNEAGISVGSVKVKAAEIEKRVSRCNELLRKYSVRSTNSSAHDFNQKKKE